MEKKERKQPLEELVEILKTLQEKEKAQVDLVRRFQKLISNNGFSIINDFPYPMAIFEQDGDLVYVNSALSKKAGLYPADFSRSKNSLFNRITDANLSILDAGENVFMGKTTFLSDLSDPMDIFMSERANRKILSSVYREAVFFPIADDDGQVTHGAVIFME